MIDCVSYDMSWCTSGYPSSTHSLALHESKQIWLTGQGKQQTEGRDVHVTTFTSQATPQATLGLVLEF